MNALRFASGLFVLLGGASLTACKDGPPKMEGQVAAKPAPATNRNNAMPDWKKAFSHKVRFDAARKAVVVDVQIQPGFHAYAPGESTGKPLLVTIDEGGDFVGNGTIQYPKGKEKNLPIGRSVIVEGAAEIVAPVKPKAEAPGKAKGKFRYQVCTDSACDRPRTIPFEVGPA